MENIRSYGNGLPIRVAAIFGGVEEEAQIKALRKGVQIVVATPGRLSDLLVRQAFNKPPFQIRVEVRVDVNVRHRCHLFELVQVAFDRLQNV